MQLTLAFTLNHYLKCFVYVWSTLLFYADFIFRLHRSTTGSCCYRRSSMICQPVCRSICLSQSWALQKWLNQSRCYLGCGLGWAQGTMYYMWSRFRMQMGCCFEGKKGSPRNVIVKYRDFSPWAVQKRLKRSRCCLGCRLGWVQGSMY